MSHGSTLFNNQVPAKGHLVQPGGGLSGEIFDLRSDLKLILNRLAAIGVSEYTDAATAVANGVKLSIATVAAPVTYSGAQLDGATGGVFPIARNVTVTTGAGTPADAPATATINGTYNGKAQSEVITLAQTNTIATGVKPFDKVTSIVLPAADGTGTTLTFGFGPSLGVGLPVKARAGGTQPIKEIMDNTTPTAGTLTTTGLYTPNTAPNGAHDYCIYYEFDPAAT